jgi:hypothetical protein
VINVRWWNASDTSCGWNTPMFGDAISTTINDWPPTRREIIEELIAHKKLTRYCAEDCAVHLSALGTRVLAHVGRTKRARLVLVFERL